MSELELEQQTNIKFVVSASAPNDFFLFPKITEILKGRHFYDTGDITSNKKDSSEGHSTKPVPKLF
jgi:hypothetical protein